MRRRTEEQVRALYAEYAAGSLSFQQFCREKRADKDILRRDFRTYGLEILRRSKPPLCTEEQFAAIHARYLVGETLEALGKEFGVSITSLKNAFKKRGFSKKDHDVLHEQRLARMRSTNQERYGVEYAVQNDVIKEKVLESWKKVDVKEVVEKRRRTCRERYDVENPSQARFVKEKKRRASLEKYGTEYVLQSDEIINRTREIRFERRLAVLEPLLAKRGYKLLGEYAGNSVREERKHKEFIKYDILHESCGLIFKDDVFEIPRCPACFPLNMSVAEKDFGDFIERLGVKVERGNRSLIKKPSTGRFYELDIYIPEKRIAFEYNGVFYHADRKDHHIKTALCLEAGVRLYHIWEYQNREHIENRIKVVLGLLPGVSARETVWREIPVDEANALFEEHHLQGGTQAYFASGLFLEGSLVATLSIRKYGEGDSEIARFCTVSGLRVVGGFQKLLKNSLPYIEGKQLVTYSDRDWCPASEDSVYFKSGFRCLGDSGPMLSYFDPADGRVHSRQKFQKHKLAALFPDLYDPELTATEILAQAGVFPLWNSGNWKFVLDLGNG